MIYLSIIIPAYNEANRIGPTLDAISEYLKQRDFTYEIIVVDDGSTDQSVSVIEKYRLLFSNFISLKNEKNRGKGYSVKRGMLSACGEYRLFMDADHSVKIDNFDNFLNETKKGADIVIGSIELPGSEIKDNNQWYRRILGKMSKKLIQFVIAPGIYDTQRGFKLFTKKSIDIIFPKQTITRWGFDIELITIAIQHNLKIKEVPVIWLNGKDSSVGVGAYLTTFAELVKIKINSWQG